MRKIDYTSSEMEVVMDRLISFLADLNGSNWIQGNDPGSIDMRQRAKALQQIAFKTLHSPDRNNEYADQRRFRFMFGGVVGDAQVQNLSELYLKAMSGDQVTIETWRAEIDKLMA